MNWAQSLSLRNLKSHSGNKPHVQKVTIRGSDGQAPKELATESRGDPRGRLGAKAAQGQTCEGNAGGKESESVLGAHLLAAVIGPTKRDSRPPRVETRGVGRLRDLLKALHGE